MRAILGYLRRHHLALVAILIATTGTAWASAKLPHNSVGKAQIRKNAVVSSKVKNHSLRKKDFKAGQLPAGKRGPAGSQGPAGVQGATGPRGLAGSARAYAWIQADSIHPTLDPARSKGFADVTHMNAGQYCLKLAAGTDADGAAPVVTPIFNNGLLTNEFAMPEPEIDCPGSQIGIFTFDTASGNMAHPNDSISFTIAIP